MEWKEEYSSGMGEIDRQHKDLFNMTDNLGALLEQEIYYGPKMEELIGLLTAYTKSHFVYEEMCMRSRICPASDKNKKAHDHFLQFFGDFVDDYRMTGGSLESFRKLHGTLQDWLISHICKIDIHLKNCVYK